MFYRQIGDGSARAETNSSQSVTSTLTPDAFGNAVATTGSTGSSYQFGATSGYRNDGDAGLLKVGCRYYDPQVGAFTTRGTYLDQKPYLYCEHDPVNATDPSGHTWKWYHWAIAAAVVVAVIGLGLITAGSAYVWIGGLAVTERGVLTAEGLVNIGEGLIEYVTDLENIGNGLNVVGNGVATLAGISAAVATIGAQCDDPGLGPPKK